MDHKENRPNDESNNAGSAQTPTSFSKQPYTSPIVTDFGRIEDLTLDLITGPPDAGLGGSAPAA